VSECGCGRVGGHACGFACVHALASRRSRVYRSMFVHNTCVSMHVGFVYNTCVCIQYVRICLYTIRAYKCMFAHNRVCIPCSFCRVQTSVSKETYYSVKRDLR
jgi:hypothetical protein